MRVPLLDDPAVSPPATAGRLAGSPQQEAFWSELLEGDSHVLLEARAGTGKSTSCREGMHRLAGRGGRPSIRYCCFNKAIADEFRRGCPEGVDVGTMHSFGFRALQSAFRPVMDDKKTFLILDQLNGPEKRYVRSSIRRLASAFKGHRPGLEPSYAVLDDLALFLGIETWNQEELIYGWTARVVRKSDAMTSVIDYDDMLRMPVIHAVKFPAVDFLFIDEAQDLNPIQHALAERLSGSGRTVVVGDSKQAIYAFRGADSRSMDRLRETLDARVLPLTVTRRCPRLHVDLARKLVPDFEAAPEAPDGVLERGNVDRIDSAAPGDLILCRANAPLIKHCLHAIASRRKATVRGRQIGDSLQAVVRRLGDPATIADFSATVSRWRSREIGRLEAKDGTEPLIEAVNDKADCLDAVASSCSSPAEVPGVIRELFSDGDSTNRITFSSVHRAKGSEADDVYLIDVPYSLARDRKRPPQQWEMDQRRNLAYVAATRSKHRLTIVTPD